ncbi:MAG TPA: MotA/TolQ/ExbB proton channel family protein [Pirellulales bacterium]|jgi:biopolymer transport protein ExbB/TolQ
MMSPRKRKLPQWVDLPMAVAAVLTVLFYVVVNLPAFNGSIIHRYTTEHVVEYVVVTFFIWGLVDVIFKACGFPLELMALRQPGLPQRLARESIDAVGALEADLQSRPAWFLDSRLGHRLIEAINYLMQKESAEGFEEHLRYLAQQDEERTYMNYGLVRFICWVAPVLGILGTVIHFASAFVGMAPDQVTDNLQKIMGEIGTAFSTTTVALAAAITMMFSLFMCEKTEKGIVHAINRRVEKDLLSRFEVVDESLTPFLNAVSAGNKATLSAMDGTLERQLKIWSSALGHLQQDGQKRLETHAQLWEQSLVRIHDRFQQSDAQRDQKLLKLLGDLQSQRQEQTVSTEKIVNQVASLEKHFSQLADTLSGLVHGEGELVKLQTVLNQNLHGIRETQQLDQALHGLSAAIHLLTARYDLEPKAKSSRAA